MCNICAKYSWIKQRKNDINERIKQVKINFSDPMPMPMRHHVISFWNTLSGLLHCCGMTNCNSWFQLVTQSCSFLIALELPCLWLDKTCPWDIESTSYRQGVVAICIRNFFLNFLDLVFGRNMWQYRWVNKCRHKVGLMNGQTKPFAQAAQVREGAMVMT